MSLARVFAPGSIGNVGPGFDVLGLVVASIGDEVEIELTGGGDDEVTVSGRDAVDIPVNPARNSAVIAARALLARFDASHLRVRAEIVKGLPFAGGLGGSAASAVGGALATALALGIDDGSAAVLEAAFEAESAVAGPHLDNIAPALYGGLNLILSTEPPEVVTIAAPESWWLALVTPHVRIETRRAREVLPTHIDRATLIHQTAAVAALVQAFAAADPDLAWRALRDHYAEPARAPLIPSFGAAKRAAMECGVLGCSISGSGPTIFAIAEDEAGARAAADAMSDVYGAGKCDVHVAPMSNQGARAL